MVSQAERRAATIAAILKAAEKEFGTRGFDATTIDDIAVRAGVAKGAVYHHFDSKEEIFEQVLDSILAGIARELPAIAARGRDLVDQMVLGTEAYLLAVTAADTRRILLIDGPAVLGWNKWRAIDQRHFGHMTNMPLAPGAGNGMKRREIATL